MSLLLSTAVFLLFVPIVLVLTQDLQLFPGAVTSIFKSSDRDPRTLPPEIESSFIDTSDGKRLEVWRLPAAEDEEKKHYIGLVFHGNAGSLEDFLLLQLWFQEQGITSYSFDYRGFGRSQGWPNEDGIYKDSDAFYRYVFEREGNTPENTIVLGFSLGGAFAARIAALHQVKALILVSAFSSIPNLLKDIPLFQHLVRFCRYSLPTIQHVATLQKTHLLLLHGEKDRTIPPTHAQEIQDVYQGNGNARKISSDRAGHNNVFYLERQQLADALKASLDEEQITSDLL